MQKGDYVEIRVASEFMAYGFKVLKPLSSGLRYDLIVEDFNGKFLRIQVKSGYMIRGTIRFRTFTHRGVFKERKFYGDAIDLYAVVVPGKEDVYIFSHQDVPVEEGCFRLTDPKNQNRKLIKWAKDYLFHKWYERNYTEPLATPIPCP